MGRIKIGRIYSMKVIEVEAVKDNLEKIIDFIKDELSDFDCPSKTIMKIRLAVEEIFVNIASYAYGEETGMAEIIFDYKPETNDIYLTFIDSGVQYDPLAKEDPDITLSAAERQIGGLGIYMVKKSMDDMRYEYRNGQNFLTITKKLKLKP